MNISVVASSASSRVWSARRQNRKIAGAYRPYNSPQASESPARTCVSTSANSAALTSEGELRRQLNAPRPAAAQERVADANVACRGKVIETLTDAVRPDALLRCIRNERRQERV